jgi:aconitate hydratase
MKGTLTLRLLMDHAVDGDVQTGHEIGLKIDQTLTQDATGTLVYLAFEAMGKQRIQVEKAVSYVDHNIIQTDSRNADDHRFLQSAAAKYGAVFSPPGNGVSHHVQRQRFGKPGQTLLGSDSHTTTGGCLGMLAMGAGGVEVALAMGGSPYHLTVPRVWGVYVHGALRPYVSGKDVILSLLGTFSCQYGVGKVIELYGPGVAALGMADRATIANMAVDMGLTAAVFPSDEITRRYLARNGREDDWRPLAAEAKPEWDEHTELDLSTVEPLVACPSNPDNVATAASLGDVDVHQVIIGSSCNGSFRDFMTAAKIVEGKGKHHRVSFEINPGSRQTLANLIEQGGMSSLVAAGARVQQPGCLGCIGMGQAPATDSVSLRTFPRNFKGRSGTQDDAVFLCSPETAAASALTGKITDPTKLKDPPTIKFPARFSFEPSWLIPPSEAPESVAIERGPNIKPFPELEPLPDTLDLTVGIKAGDNISTDAILAGGNRVLPYRSNIPKISEFVFETIDPTFAKRATQLGNCAVLGGENYGQGSSREHAALAPRFLGVRVKVALSFARIHKANLINFGVLPLTFARREDYERAKAGQRLSMRGLHSLLSGTQTHVPVHFGSEECALRLDASRRERKILLAGGVLNYQREKLG